VEVVNPQVSKFWNLIVDELKNLGLVVSPILPKRYFRLLPLILTSVQPSYQVLQENDEIEQDRVCNAQHVKNKGEKNNTNKKGDICGMRVKEANGIEWEVIIEAKNYTTPQNPKLTEFYDRGYKHNNTMTKEIYIYVSLNPMMDTPTVKSRKKRNKVFLLINGLEAENCSLDIHFLSGPNRISVHELVQKLAPSIAPTPTIQNLTLPGTK
jgi:hypothetical protein